MAQGSKSLRKRPTKSNKKSQVKQNAKKNPNKSKKFSAHANLAYKTKTAVTKSINKRNEALVASRAIAHNGSKSDTTFRILKDMNDTGNKEIKLQNRLRTKAEKKASNVTARLQEQLKKLNK